MPSLAVDLGGTYFRSAIALDDGTLGAIHETRLHSIFDGVSPERVWDSIDALVSRASDEARATLRDDDPAVIAFPGPIAEGRRIVSAPTLTGSAQVPGDLQERFVASAKRPVRFVNDLAAAARHLAGKVDETRFFVVTVSSGIGSRVVVRGDTALEPAHAGEIGHVVVDHRPNAVSCDCGGRGHLGAIASGRGIERAARASAAADGAAFALSACVTTFGATATTLTNERHLVPAVLQGDAWAGTIVAAAAAELAKVVSTLVVAAGLERVYVIGGFATALGETYRAMLVDALRPLHDSPATAIDLDALVRIATLDERACLRGTALFA
jgi:glucokinase